MSSAYNLPDYRARYFEYKDLTKILGEPDVDSILILLRQCKRNAQRVYTTLGGGQLGYLALCIEAAYYNVIPGATPFIRPVDPGTFNPVVPLGVRAVPLTPADIATQKIAFDEEKRKFNECQAVETALRNQIVEAIDPEYLQPLRNATTDMLNDPIPDIFSFLSTTYGELSPSELKERELMVDDTVYDPSKNIDTVFNKIQEYQDLCTLLQNPKTDKQLVTYAYLIFQKSGIFMQSLKDWNVKLPGLQTFPNFKIFMRQQHRELKKVGGLTIQNSSLNMMKEIKMNQEEISHTLKAEIREGILETLQAFSMNQENVDPNTITPPNNHGFGYPGGYNYPVEHNYIPSIDNNMNQVSTATSLADLMKEIQTMKSTISNLTLTNQQLQNQSGQGGHPKRNGVEKDVNPVTGKAWKRYCWSCGCCAHWSRNCPTKKKGHKDDATFRNRMNGSNLNCM